MKLNYDCVRDVLLYLESLPAYDQNHRPTSEFFEFGKLPEALLIDYSEDDIMYSLYQLLQSGMINASDESTFSGPCLFYKGITPCGHEFISNTRSPKIWSEAKKTVLEKVGDASISIISSLAVALTMKGLGL